MLSHIKNKLEQENRITLKAKIIPKSSKNEITETASDHIKIKVTAIPKNNKANEAVIKLLSKKLHISKNKIQITKGKRSSNKTIILNK